MQTAVQLFAVEDGDREEDRCRDDPVDERRYADGGQTGAQHRQHQHTAGEPSGLPLPPDSDTPPRMAAAAPGTNVSARAIGEAAANP